MNRDQKILVLIAASVIAAAVLDIVVRRSVGAWTDGAFIQWLVSVSPLVYLASLAACLAACSSLPVFRRPRFVTAASVAMIVYSLCMIAQIFLHRQNLGGAVYSLVFPLFVSGVLAGLLLFAVYFRMPRGPLASYFMSALCVLWMVLPIACDYLYVSSRGYRGLMPIQQLPIIGTCYDFLIAVSALGLFVMPFALLYGVFALLYELFRHGVAGLLPRSATYTALAVFCLHVVNMGGYIWD